MLALLLIVVVLVLLASFLHFFISSKKLGVPGPLALPIIGNGLTFIGDTSTFLVKFAKYKEAYGNVFRFYLGPQLYVIITEPKFLEKVLSSTEIIDKAFGYTFLHPWLGLGLLTSTGQRWQAHRKLITPTFHFNILQSFLPIFLKNQKILNDILQKQADGRQIDLFPIMALAALDNVAESAMGIKVNALEDSDSEYVRAIGIISEITMKRIFNPFLGAEPIFNLLPHRTAYDKAVKILHTHTRKVIKERQQQIKESNITMDNYMNNDLGIKKKVAFLDMLLLSKLNGEPLDLESVKEEVDTFMFEGHDTTTSAICFTLYCISQNKGIDEKILEEQRLILGNDLKRDPTFSEVQEMKYLELVIKESLRLYPSVPLIARCVKKDTVICDYNLPKDTNISMDIFNLQRDPKYFDDPLEFRPERYEKGNNDNKVRDKVTEVYKYIPFSAGARNCIGQKYAMMELKVVISGIVKNFEILPCSVKPILASDLVLKSKNGVLVKLLPRD